VAALVCEPLVLSHSFFARDDIMTRRFVVGHNPGEDGTLSIARPWRHARGENPGGGLATSVADLLRFARFHLGDGRAASGTLVLPTPVLQQMQEPTAKLHASNLGDAIGLGWFLRDMNGVRTVGHGGRPTASSPSCSSSPNGTSRSYRCPTPARVASPSIRQS
jgi:CubicO group peptidase (beta-lactamase class C family)